MSSQYAHIIANMLFVITLILVAFYALKKFKLMKYDGNRIIKVVNVVPIGTKEKILLVEVNKTKLLLGATPNHIETLYVFNEAELVEECEGKTDVVTKTFMEQMQSVDQSRGN